MKLTGSAMASTKRSIDAHHKAANELGLDDNAKTIIRERVDKLTPLQVKDELATHTGARLAGSVTQCRHRLQLILCGESFPVNADEEPDDGEIIAQDHVDDEQALLKQQKEIADKLKTIRKNRNMISKALEDPVKKELTRAEHDAALSELQFEERWLYKLAENNYIVFRLAGGRTPGMLRIGVIKTMNDADMIIQRLEHGGVATKPTFEVCPFDNMSDVAFLDGKKQADDILQMLKDTIKSAGSSSGSAAGSTTPSTLNTPRSQNNLGADINKRKLDDIDAAIGDKTITIYGDNGTKLSGGARTAVLKKRRSELVEKID